MMRLVTILLTIILSACNQLPPAPIPAAGAAITGTVVERVDGVPYSYLRLATEQGEIWAAVPMESVTRGGKVTIKNGAPVKNFTAPGIGKKFEGVVFGVVEKVWYTIDALLRAPNFLAIQRNSGQFSILQETGGNPSVFGPVGAMVKGRKEAVEFRP